jgi:segregation and condensation protein A
MSTPKASARRRAAPAASPQPPAAEPQGGARRAAAGSARPAGTPSPVSGAARPAPSSAPFDGQYRLELPKAGFEGPLDLLLHLIQQHELDILDIPVGFVTEKFLQYIQLMRTLSIDIASEYLVMAATLVHIKSKMLLPSVPAGQDDDGLPGEDEEDPRAELVRRLLEYQKYKAAAAELAERGTLGKDIFSRGSPEPVPEGPAPFAGLGVFSLLDAFEKLLKRTNVRLDHEVVFDRISITDRIVELTETLTYRRAMRFDELLVSAGEDGRPLTRFDVVITFLAVLEMCRLRLIRVYQSDPLAPIHLELAVQDQAADAALEDAPAVAPVVEASSAAPAEGVHGDSEEEAPSESEEDAEGEAPTQVDEGEG